MNFKPLLLSVAIALSITACATTTSPTGRNQVIGVSDAQLNQMGEQAFAQAKAQKPQSRDSRQRAYVGCVFNAVVRELPPQWQQLRWEFALFEDAGINAWALPGGKVGVFTGIFKAARNQDQLAGVIAHEIGHVVSRHHNERITRQQGASTGLQILSAIIGARYGQGAANAAGQFGSIGAQGLILLPNSRVQEAEADEVGQRLMAQAGFDPRGAVSLWQNMAATSSGARQPEWMSSHPDPASRLRELQQRADGLVPTMEAARRSGRTPRCQ